MFSVWRVAEAWHSRLMYMEGSCYVAIADIEGSCCVAASDEEGSCCVAAADVEGSSSCQHNW